MRRINFKQRHPKCTFKWSYCIGISYEDLPMFIYGFNKWGLMKNSEICDPICEYVQFFNFMNFTQQVKDGKKVTILNS